ncbi:MAG: hypothetical protein QM800_13450 [Paludibacter sp.]
MKKLIFSLITLMVFQLTASAQYEYGTYYIDANLNFDSSNEKVDNAIAFSTNNNAYNLNPEIGYFIKNNLAIGIGLNYKHTFSSDSYTPYKVLNSDLSLNYSLSPTTLNELNEIAPAFFIKYFFQPTKNLSLSLKASYSKGWGTYNLIQKYVKKPDGEETIVLSEKNKIESKYIFLSPELQYLLTRHVGLQVNFNGLGYVSTTKYANDDFFFNSYNPSLSKGSTTKSNFEGTNFNIKPSAWSFGVFILLN